MVLSLIINVTIIAAYDLNVSKTVTVGVPFVIDSATDLGFSDRAYRYGEYTLSNPSAFALSIEQYSKSPYSGEYCYRYTLTPTIVGIYTFSETISGRILAISPYTELYKITYNINVVDVTSISIGINSLSLSLGETYIFSPSIQNPNATTTLTWTSSNTSVATINDNGLLTTKGIGTTTITCTAHNGVSAQCEVTVNPVKICSITLNQENVDMTVGEDLQLEAIISPDNATDKSVTWSSTNETVAFINENGLVTAVGSGTCFIKATANDGSGKSASCKITVAKNNKLTITDVTQCKGGRGLMNVLLTDEETILGFQFDLQLPDGVTVATDDNGKLMASLTGNATNTHSISSNKISESLYRFMVTPNNLEAISNANGDGMSITIDVDDDMAVGVYDLTIKDIQMTVRRNGTPETIDVNDNTAKLTISEIIMGDVNGDARVNVTDVICIKSYLHENVPARFIFKAADMDGNGKVSITDAVLVIDKILSNQ